MTRQEFIEHCHENLGPVAAADLVKVVAEFEIDIENGILSEDVVNDLFVKLALHLNFED